MDTLLKTSEVEEYKRRLKVALIFTVPIFLLHMIFSRMPGASGLLRLHLIPGLSLLNTLLLLLATPVQVKIAAPFYLNAWKAVKVGGSNMDVLIVLGTSAAYGYSCAALLVSVLSAGSIEGTEFV